MKKAGGYDHKKIENKWQEVWAKTGIYSPDLDRSKKPFYNLMMFPYPSAEGMHVGNMYAFTGADIYGRFMRMRGYDVFEPIGLDGFGIHSENYALKIGRHPMEQAKISQKNFYRQLHEIGNSYDFSRTLQTYDPDYYKWTQWIFVQMFKNGLAVRKKASVNFCPSCKTVLSDEQVISKLKTQSSKLKAQNSKLKIENGKQMANNSERITNNPEPGEKVSVCERCESVVEKKELEQWFFKITKHAQGLLDNIDHLSWSEKVKVAQRQWIGRSEGTEIKFTVPFGFAQGKPFGSAPRLIARGSAQGKQNSGLKIGVFTVYPETVFGVTYLVLAPEHEIIALLLNEKRKTKNEKHEEIRRYVEGARKRTAQERLEQTKEKTGVFTGLYAVNPVNGDKVPVWIADYVLAEYGTGAVMGVPAHDKRDYEFAKKYNLPIKAVLLPQNSKFPSAPLRTSPSAPLRTSPSAPLRTSRIRGSKLEFKINGEWVEGSYEGEGTVINSGYWNDWQVPRDKEKIIDDLVKKGIGKRKIQYHLRDWLISRQRYWGPPIPMIYCQKCFKENKSWFTAQAGVKVWQANSQRLKTNNQHLMSGWYPVPEEDLPVKLPYIENYKPLGTGQSPLATHEEFYRVKCPHCGSPAKRETDVSDTFLDSSWYFLRYPATDLKDAPFASKAFAKSSKQPGVLSKRVRWLPVNMYIGGAEHSVLHLLYSRFITMVLKDMGFIDFEEPFTRFFAHGLLIKEGAKMSKSKGNIINPDEYIEKYGADTLRMYLMFLGPFAQGGDFYDSGIEGMARFIRRVWKVVGEVNVKCQMSNVKTKLSLVKTESDLAESPIDGPTSNGQNMRFMHNTIKKVTDDLGKLDYNTAIASLMQYYNFLTKQESVSREEAIVFLKLLAPFAPYITEELFQSLSQDGKTKSAEFASVHLEKWPEYDPKYLEQEDVVIVVQVNGKKRDAITVHSSQFTVHSVVEERARGSQNVKKYLEGKTVKKVIYVEGKLINFVVV